MPSLVSAANTSRLASYESVFIVDGSLDKEATDKAVHVVQEHVTKAGGHVEKLQELGKRTLAYPIHKKREGTYYLMQFTSPAAAIASFRQVLALAEPILRFVVLKLET